MWKMHKCTAPCTARARERDFQMSLMHQTHLKLFMSSKEVGEREIKIQRQHESMRGWSGNTDTRTLTDHSYFVWLKTTVEGLCAYSMQRKLKWEYVV